MTSRTVIYEDLDIDYSDHFKDPLAFNKRVHDKAEEIKTLLRSNNSVQVYIDGLKPTEDDLTDVDKLLNSIYEFVESNVAIVDMPTVANKLRKLAGQIEWLAKDKAMLELAKQNGSMDKSVIHQQYVDLRDKFNRYVDAMNLIHPEFKDELEKLPAMPGNYGSNSLLTTFRFRFGEEEDTYGDHRMAAKRLGMTNYREILLQDFIDYVESTPVGVTVTRITK